MKFLIILGFLLGFGGVLAAAGLAPIAVHDRIPSRASVANNGGRLESLVIRLPADRVATTGNLASDAIAVDPITRLDLPAELTGAEFLAEQFKIRNIDGDVIGIAMRHWTRSDAQSASTWSVSIPSRGSLLWRSAGDTPARLAAALAGAGAQSGVAWQGELTIPVAADEGASEVLLGTEEFAGSEGRVDEVWEISGLGRNGELQGTITLTTRVSQSQ